MTSVTNNSKIRQMVHTKSGVIQIPPEKTRDLELSPYGRKLVDASPDLSVRSGRRKTKKPAESK